MSVSHMEQINDPHHLDPSDPHNLQGAETPVLERILIATEGEDCDECVRKLREPLMHIDGVQEVMVDTKADRIAVTFDARKTHAPALHEAILRSGYKPGAFAS
ncbi:MAG: cation transporter [Verrucomicrobia bacterium]|nr:cation transporter [Verrucomicrobiota bacterium]